MATETDDILLERIRELIHKKRLISSDIILMPPLARDPGERPMPLADAQARIDFVKSYCALINTRGGTLVFGIDIERDTPQAIEGLDVEACAATHDECVALIGDKIVPAVAQDMVSCRSIPLETGACISVVDVPKGPDAPYAILPPFRGYEYGALLFYTLEQGRLTPMDIDMVRKSFSAAPGSPLEEMERMARDRVAAIHGGITPVPLVPTAKMVVHLMPLSAFTSETSYDLEGVEESMHIPDFAEKGRFSTHGYLAHYSDLSYVYFYRNGIVEIVDAFYLKPLRNGERKVPLINYQKELERILDVVLSVYRELSVHTPLYATLSLVGVKDYVVPLKMPRKVLRLERDLVSLPLTKAMDDIFSIHDRKTVLINSMLEMLWDASGERV